VSGPDATNMTETVSASVDPCITPFGTTTLVAGCDHHISRESLQKESIRKSYQRPSNDSVNVRNIPSTAAANIPMHEDISSGCPGDRSDNVVTNLTAHFTMGVSHENAFTLSPVPGNVMTGTCNCNCNFDMNIFLERCGKLCVENFD
jgi:hypothetical protein